MAITRVKGRSENVSFSVSFIGFVVYNKLYCDTLTDKSAVAKSIKINSDSSPASSTDTDFSPLSSSEKKKKKEKFEGASLKCIVGNSKLLLHSCCKEV